MGKGVKTIRRPSDSPARSKRHPLLSATQHKQPGSSSRAKKKRPPFTSKEQEMPGRRRSRRRRGSAPGKQPVADEEAGGGGVYGEDGGSNGEQPDGALVSTGGEGGRGSAEGGEGGGSGKQPRAVVATVEGGGGGGDGQGGKLEQPRAGEDAQSWGGGGDGKKESDRRAATAQAGRDSGGVGVGGNCEQQRPLVMGGLGVADRQPRQPMTVAEEKEGYVDPVLQAWQGGCFFLNAVLKLRVEDVTNADLFREKVNKIPSLFTSVDEYLKTYSTLLIEEFRAQIHFNLSTIGERKPYLVRSISHTSTHDVYFIDIDMHKLGGSHIAKDGDMFLLEEANMVGYFGIVVGAGRNTKLHKSFRLLISKFHCVKSFESVNHATFLINIMEGIHISKAMRYIEHSTSITESVLCIGCKEKTERKCMRCEELACDGFVDANKFSDEQLGILKYMGAKLICSHNNTCEIIYGPPSSGKTRIAVGLIHLMLNWRYKMLVCVPTEKEIIKFLQTFSELYSSSNLSNFLVINDLNGLEECNTYGEATLKNKAQQLFCCTYVWESFLKETYFILQMKPYCKDNNCDHEGKICTTTNLAVFSLVKFREKTCALASDLRKISDTLLSSMSPTTVLCDNTIEDINKLKEELSCFKKLMLYDGLTTSELQIAFGFSSVCSVSEVVVSGRTESLNESRLKCLQLIEKLIDSVVLPDLKSRDDLEEFCIANSRVIICTPSSSSYLLGLKSCSVDILVVDDAARIRESDLLVPLSLEPRHTILLGDHLHLQPLVKSEVCKEAGYACSLFKRLLHLSSERKELTKLFMMNPVINQFVGEHFYDGKVEDASTIVSHDKLPFALFDVTHVDELRREGISFIENAVVILLLKKLCKGLKNANSKLNVGVVCLCNNRVDALRKLLDTEYVVRMEFNLEVNSLDDLCEKWYDVIILSALVDDKSELPEGNKMNTALTRSRRCLWIVAEADGLLANEGIWKKLVDCADENHCITRMKSHVLSKVMERVEANKQGGPSDANSAFQRNIMQKIGHEFTWEGRPNNTKNIFAPLRDQKNAPDTCTFQAILGAVESLNKFKCSCLDPPQDFPWYLCSNDLKCKYDGIVDEEFKSEGYKKRGKHRLETVLDAIKDHGVTGSHKDDSELIFKINSYEQLDVENAEETEALVEAGHIMVGHFRMSRNYFYLEPGETYVYDRCIPYINPRSGLAGSHAVMVIGHGKQPPAEGLTEADWPRHINIQNSEGKIFGINGLGRVSRQSLRGLYKITVPELVPSVSRCGSPKV